MDFKPGPIAAISTSCSSKAALGIVRVSGFSDLKWLESLTKSKKSSSCKPRYAYFSQFFDDDGVIDEGLYTFFKGPKSFTGEDLVEFSLHGNPLLLEKFLSLLCTKYNFRLAKPGEFSFRALKNKKLNLTQVEGLDLLLNANSGFGLSAGTRGLNNELYESYVSLKREFLEIRSCIELLIDFSEDVGEKEIHTKMNSHIENFSKFIGELKARSTGDLSDILTPQVSLIGATNAGKSTLFNKLLGRERAIVSDVHGTTRDYISEFFFVDQLPFKLVDTAGLRITEEHVEKIGIEHALKINENSFFKTLVINPFVDLPFGVDEIDYDCVVFTHADLDGFYDRAVDLIPLVEGPYYFSGPMGANFESGPMGADSESGPMGANSRSGPIEPLSNFMSDISTKYQALMESNPIPIQRHRNLILDIYSDFYEFSEGWRSTSDMAIASSLCMNVSRGIDELLGIVSSQDVLDHIFENFCIGK